MQSQKVLRYLSTVGIQALYKYNVQDQGWDLYETATEISSISIKPVLVPIYVDAETLQHKWKQKEAAGVETEQPEDNLFKASA